MSSRVAIITGAAQGIGRGIALRLAADGLDIVVTDVPSNAERLEEVVSAIRAQGRKAVGVTGDASVEADVQNLVQLAVTELGSVDVFVANAGIMLWCSLLDTTLDQWDHLMNINARGVFLAYKTAAKQMIKQGRGGRIIGACSTAGKRAAPKMGVYSGSKFFVRGLTQAAAQEWGQYGITVNAYAPGVIDTPMVQTLAADLKVNHEDPTGEWLENFRKSAAVKSLGYPEDIAALVSYLASEESKFVTGQAINVNGGTVFD
ncbi:acetoin reductase family protein [Ramaria rubella]|nr:acetoin reductase family protein [Ramaria rubella]